MKWLLLTFYLLELGVRIWLRHLNLQHLQRHGHEIPAGFEGFVEQAQLNRASDYALANSRVGLAESLLTGLLLVIFLFCGLLEWYDGWVRGLAETFVGQGVLFVLGLMLVQSLLDIPFNLYRTFVLEERFRFNVTTPGLWCLDMCKSLVIGALLLSAVTAGALWMARTFPENWWLWVWGLLSLISVVLIYLAPVLIEPIFFKFEPLRDRALAEKLKAVMKSAGLLVDRVQQVDASRRSRHSNAYFTGIGRVKRIVLFDTLLDQMSDDEIVGVLAHEAGHWKLGHIWKRLATMAAVTLAVCWAAWKTLDWGGLESWFGLEGLGFVAQLMLFGFLVRLVGFPFGPLASALSRRQERQADRFAATLTGNPASLGRALVKLCKENLSNLHPHPLYAWFHYSHPPVVERVSALNEQSGVR